MFSLQPPAVTSIFSSFLPLTVKAYTGSSSLLWQPTMFAAPPLGVLWPLVCFCFSTPFCFVLHCSWKCLSSPHRWQNWPLAGQLESRPKCPALPHRWQVFSRLVLLPHDWFLLPWPLFVPSMWFTLAEFSPFPSMVIAASCASTFLQFSAISSTLALDVLPGVFILCTCWCTCRGFHHEFGYLCLRHSHNLSMLVWVWLQTVGLFPLVLELAVWNSVYVVSTLGAKYAFKASTTFR